jgi:hypothetical protein
VIEAPVVEMGVGVYKDRLVRQTHFTVTLLARFRGLSGSFPRNNAA